jgi:hypothetical protein
MSICCSDWTSALVHAGPSRPYLGITLTRIYDKVTNHQSAVANRIDLTVIPVEPRTLPLRPGSGWKYLPCSEKLQSWPQWTMPSFRAHRRGFGVLGTQARRRVPLRRRRPSEEARDYILGEWKPWERVLAGLRDALADLGLLEAAERLNLRSPSQDFFHPLFSAGWQLDSFPGIPPSTDHDQLVRRAQ